MLIIDLAKPSTRTILSGIAVKRGRIRVDARVVRESVLDPQRIDAVSITTGRIEKSVQ